jgi:peroxiredoxin (alkyl hydroperoxide reductase subunit C)
MGRPGAVGRLELRNLRQRIPDAEPTISRNEGVTALPLAIGAPAPEFTLLNQNREPVSRDDLKGSKSVIVFIPFAFTRTCESELCQIRDEYTMFNDADARVVAIDCNTLHANRVWADQQGFLFDILSDFWPHGEVSRRYDTFNETFGYAERTTYFLDEDGVITGVTRSDELGQARNFDDYVSLLA